STRIAIRNGNRGPSARSGVRGRRPAHPGGRHYRQGRALRAARARSGCPPEGALARALGGLRVDVEQGPPVRHHNSRAAAGRAVRLLPRGSGIRGPEGLMSDSLQPFRSSEQFELIAAALAKAQGAIVNPLKDKTAQVQTKSGGAYSYSYADLATVLDVVRKPFSDNELALVQCPRLERDGLLHVETRLIHSSGQWIACTLQGRVTDARPQDVGAAITYLRRYGLIALAGMAAEDDDDAQRTARPRQEAAPAAPARAP